MGTRAFVARSGWRKTPISLDELAQAVAESPDLELRQGIDGDLRALLRGSSRRRLTWHEGYLAAHHTNPRMAAAVFDLAERLGAEVYSERRHRYADLADWARRTGEALPSGRERRGASMQAALAGRPQGWLWLAMVIGLVAVLAAELA
jgi:hypothetical protein